jgi:hypothetical protein
MRISRKTQPQQDYPLEPWIREKMKPSWSNIGATFLNKLSVTRYVLSEKIVLK